MATRRFVSAFLATMILIGAMIGFAVICLSKELYMPGRFEPTLQIGRIDSQGLYFVIAGERYIIPAAPIDNALEAITPWRLLLPAAPQWTAIIAEIGYREALEILAQAAEQANDGWF